ncbi:MAG: hypothetical protein QOH55_1524 [Microbacteriaceae bacterium]|nr:hypothetical protein [Microbacteriaceae bacterium]
MAMTLRLTEEQDRLLERLAADRGLSKNLAAAVAIELAAPAADNTEAVAAVITRLRTRDGSLLARLAEV